METSNSELEEAGEQQGVSSCKVPGARRSTILVVDIEVFSSQEET
jgi:hypothetical protein